jgi:NADH:ubiquinone oxidoreductase subunit 6 (subunit J)
MLSVYLALALILALFVISSPVISAVISLIVTIVLASFILFELNLNYVAIVYLLVYVGAILILLIFVVLAVPLENNN